MSFEDDMIKFGFLDYYDYIEFLSKKAEKMQKEITSLYIWWRNTFPIEVRIWEDSKECRPPIDSKAESKHWFDWYIQRIKEDNLIYKTLKTNPNIKNLIKIDIIYLAIEHFLKEHSVRRIVYIFDNFLKSDQKILKEIKDIEPNTEEWRLYEYFQEKAYTEYLKILKSNSLSKIIQNFLGLPVTEDAKQEYYYLIENKKNIKFDLKEIIRPVMWIMNNNALIWDDWAYKNFNSWSTLIKHAWSSLYQDVWWGKHGEQTNLGDTNYYKWCERNIKENISFTSEFKRRIILKKIAEIQHRTYIKGQKHIT